MSEKVNVHVTSNFSIRFIAPQGVSHSSQIKINLRESPAGPAVRALPSNEESVGSTPGQGAQIPHASWPK